MTTTKQALRLRDWHFSHDWIASLDTNLQPQFWPTGAALHLSKSQELLRQSARVSGQLSLLQGPRSPAIDDKLRDLYSDVIQKFITDTVNRSRFEVALSFTAQRLRQLQAEVHGLRAMQSELEYRITKIEKVALPKLLDNGRDTVSVDWDFVKSAVRSAAMQLGWDATISIHQADLRVLVLLPVSQEDSLVERSTDFYEILASNLEPAVFQALDLRLDIDEPE